MAQSFKDYSRLYIYLYSCKYIHKQYMRYFINMLVSLQIYCDVSTIELEVNLTGCEAFIHKSHILRGHLSLTRYRCFSSSKKTLNKGVTSLSSIILKVQSTRTSGTTECVFADKKHQNFIRLRLPIKWLQKAPRMFIRAALTSYRLQVFDVNNFKIIGQKM